MTPTEINTRLAALHQQLAAVHAEIAQLHQELAQVPAVAPVERTGERPETSGDWHDRRAVEIAAEDVPKHAKREAQRVEFLGRHETGRGPTD